MSDVPFTIMVRDQAIEINVDVRSSVRGTPIARFTATVGDKSLSDSTLEDLYSRLMTETKRQQAKISIPFSMFWKGKLRHGQIVGIHAGTQNAMVIWDDTHEKDTIGTYMTFYKPLTEEEAAQITATAEAVLEARARQREFTGPREMNWRVAVREALDATAGED